MESKRGRADNDAVDPDEQVEKDGKPRLAASPRRADEPEGAQPTAAEVAVYEFGKKLMQAWHPAVADREERKKMDGKTCSTWSSRWPVEIRCL